MLGDSWFKSWPQHWLSCLQMLCHCYIAMASQDPWFKYILHLQLAVSKDVTSSFLGTGFLNIVAKIRKLNDK
jgi:hypothetical protein